MTAQRLIVIAFGLLLSACGTTQTESLPSVVDHDEQRRIEGPGRRTPGPAHRAAARDDAGLARTEEVPLKATRALLISGSEVSPEIQEAGAFGILAFTSRPTSASCPRFMKICEIFLATLDSQAEADRAGIPTGRRMVTFWPVSGERASQEWMGNCPLMVDNYSVLEARDAVQIASKSAVASETGLRPGVWSERGPFLIAWSPPSAPVEERVFIFMNLSGFETHEQLMYAFRTYREEIEVNPSVWGPEGVLDLASLRIALRNFLNRYGENAVAFFAAG